MLTEFARDHAYTIAWFGLMAFIWFGWGQEDPPRSWRWRLGVGSGLGVVLAGLFGYAMFLRWGEDSALDETWVWFAVLLAVEVVAAAAGCIFLAVTRRRRWMSWWVAIVVAAHFVPLAFQLGDPSLTALGVIEVVALLVLLPRLRASDAATSRLVGPVMGVTLLAFAVVSAVIFLVKVGAPW